jgi:hypothetical protein
MLWLLISFAILLFLTGILFSLRSSKCIVQILELAEARAKLSYRYHEAIELIRGLDGDKQAVARDRWRAHRRYAHYATTCKLLSGLAILIAFSIFAL